MKQLKIAVTRKCNLSCHSCDRTKLSNYTEVSDIKEIEAIVAENEYESLVITGGEPLLDFNKVQVLLRLPIKIKILQTNGILLTSFKLEQLFRGGLTGLNINVQDFYPNVLGDRRLLQEMRDKFDLRIFLHKTDVCVEKELLFFAENGIVARIAEAKCGKCAEEDKYILGEK